MESSEGYVLAEGARLAAAKVLGLPYSVDVTKTPVEDTLQAGQWRIQVVTLGATVSRHGWPADFSVFVVPCGPATFELVGWLEMPKDLDQFDCSGAILLRLRPIEELKARIQRREVH